MLLSKSMYEQGDEKHPACAEVEPGRTITLSNVKDTIVLAKDRPANQTNTVRFHFYNVCMVGSAARSTEFVTEAIQLSP